MSEGSKRRQAHPVVQILVLTHLVLITSWSLPQPPPALENGSVQPSPRTIVSNPVAWGLWTNQRFRTSPPVQTTMLTFGLWQYWDMFAPDPSRLDIWLDAEVVYADGSTKIVPYPRMSQMPIHEKYFMERFRKYVERMNGEQYDFKWPALSQWMALKAWTDKDNPPVAVTMRRHWRDIAPYPQETSPLYAQFAFHTHAVDQAKLKADKRW